MQHLLPHMFWQSFFFDSLQATVAAIQKALSANDSVAGSDGHFLAELQKRKEEAARNQKIIASIKWTHSRGTTRSVGDQCDHLQCAHAIAHLNAVAVKAHSILSAHWPVCTALYAFAGISVRCCSELDVSVILSR